MQTRKRITPLQLKTGQLALPDAPLITPFGARPVPNILPQFAVQPFFGEGPHQR
jgi:hypothetical protein